MTTSPPAVRPVRGHTAHRVLLALAPAALAGDHDAGAPGATLAGDYDAAVLGAALPGPAQCRARGPAPWEPGGPARCALIRMPLAAVAMPDDELVG